MQIREPALQVSASGLCVHCGRPVDAQPFDKSSVEPPPEPGRAVVLARFELPPEYCGVLQYFAQFTDAQARDPSRVLTPGLTWSVRVNQRPLSPWVGLGHIANPWGMSALPIDVRLDEAAVVELVVRGESPRQEDVKLVGGRIVGRYWYNRAFGDVERASAMRRA
jgi:hypothetical protein